jgi:pimeloyl-ACP methyl ester carboxylesterase
MLKKLKLKFREKLPRNVGALLNLIAFFSPKLGAKYTLALYSKPMKGRIDENMQEFLKTATSQKILSYQKNLNIQTYHWQADGPTILLLHGWESNAWRWRLLIKILHQNKYNVVAMDAPAHGNSGSKNFNAVLYAEFANEVVKEYEPDCIIGHSVGGMATLYLASHFNNPSVQALIVMASSNKWLEVATKFHSFLGINDRILNVFEEVFFATHSNPQSYYNSEDFATKLTIPGLVIHDSTDLINLVDDGKNIHQKWSNSKFIETKGYGHSLQSKEVYKIIVNYLSEVFQNRK